MKLYLFLSIFCLIFFPLYPYFNSIEIEGMNLAETIIYQLNEFPEIMIFSFVSPLILAVSISFFLTVENKLPLDFSLRAVIFFIAASVCIFIAGYIRLGYFLWIFIAIFPLTGAFISTKICLNKNKNS